MAGDQPQATTSYPSPTAAQVGAGAGPFYGNNNNNHNNNDNNNITTNSQPGASASNSLGSMSNPPNGSADNNNHNQIPHDLQQLQTASTDLPARSAAAAAAAAAVAGAVTTPTTNGGDAVAGGLAGGSAASNTTSQHHHHHHQQQQQQQQHQHQRQHQSHLHQQQHHPQLPPSREHRQAHPDYHDALHPDLHQSASSVDDADGVLGHNHSHHPHHQTPQQQYQHQHGQHSLPLHQQQHPGQPASPQSLAQGVLSMSEDTHSAAGGAFQQQQQTPDSMRKRSKTSRACDECRRKKIRCDASELENETCSNCKRTNAPCQFSRQPMKRGPSKGYIKELADRLNTLESQLGPPSHQSDLQHIIHGLSSPDESMTQRLADGSEYSPAASALQASRKRTHSMSENNASFARDHPYSPARASAGWPLEPSRVATMQANSPSGHDLPNATNALRSPLSPNLSLRHGPPDVFRGESVSAPQETERDLEAAAALDLDEKVLNEYYRIVHPTFPFLPHSKTKLRLRLAKCPATLREAFMASLECAIRSSPNANLGLNGSLTATVKKAAELIASSQYDSLSSRNFSSSLVYIQTLIFMAQECDNHGAATMKGHAGPPRSEWLGRAIGMATHLKLNIIWSKNEFIEAEADSDLKLGRRVWWTLFILDRWHALSTSSLLQLPDNSSSLVPEDQTVLGETTYHLARLSYILGHLSSILQQPPSLMAAGSPAGPIISTTILGEIDRFRESVESVLFGSPNVVQIFYWHVRLLILRLTASTTPHELLTPATQMATLLKCTQTPLTPLNHHFTALSALTLLELAEFEETRRHAEKGLSDVLEALSLRPSLSSKEDNRGWDLAIRELVTSRNRSHADTESPSKSKNSTATTTTSTDAPVGLLRHLADAAIAGKPQRLGTGSGPDGPAFDGAGTQPGSGNSQAKVGKVVNNITRSSTDSSSNSSSSKNEVQPGDATSAPPDAERQQLSSGAGGTPAASSEVTSFAGTSAYDPTSLTRYGYLTALI